MNVADYYGNPAFNSTLAKLIVSRAPLHAWTASRSLNPDFEEEHKDEYDLGQIAHGLVLEGSEAKLVIVDAEDWRTKAAREAKAEARIAGKAPILARKMPQVRAIAKAARDAIEASELAGLFAQGEAEHVIQWQEGTVQCKAKLDFLRTDRKIVLDLKTTQNAEPNAFIRQITSLGYDVQDEFYCRGTKAKYGTWPLFVFLAVEVDAPHATCLVALNPQMREIAARKVDFALSAWDACSRSGKWPGYSNQIHYAEPNPWEAGKWLIPQEEIAA